MPSTSAQKPRTIQLTVPEGAEDGDALTFAVEGKELEIPIPPGSKPGDVLEIQVDASDSEEGGDIGISEGHGQAEKEEVSIQLSNGESLTFSTVVPESQTQEGQDSAAPSSNEEDTIDDGTYSHPWPAGIAMADFLGTLKASHVLNSVLGLEQPNKLNVVLELGSGLGLGGLSLAAQYKPKQSIQITLSDVPSGIDLLKYNLQQNSCLLESNCSVEVQPVVWNEDFGGKKSASISDSSSTFNRPVPLILASDVLYNTSSIPALLSTIKYYLGSTENSALLLAVRWRKPELERVFFEHLEGWQGKSWDLLHTPNGCSLSWKEFGNPKCVASNMYFYQTMISVQGKPYSLAKILEQQQDEESEQQGLSLLERMTDSEAKALEQCHIQIYCLRNQGKMSLNKTDEEASNLPNRETQAPPPFTSTTRKRPRED